MICPGVTEASADGTVVEPSPIWGVMEWVGGDLVYGIVERRSKAPDFCNRHRPTDGYWYAD
jgi:hypothetical protein